MFHEPMAEISMKKFDDWWLDTATNVVITWTPNFSGVGAMETNSEDLLRPAAVAWIDRG